MFSSFNGSFSKGRRASSTKFGYKRNKLIAYYDTTNASSYSGTGTTFTDLSTSANNGTISGGPTYSADGYFTWTSSDYIVTTDLDDQITGASPQHTVEVWIYPTGNGVVTQYCGSATPNTGYHHSGIEIVSGNLEFGLWSGSGITSTGPTEAISLNEWHQVVMTYNGTTVKGYLDGELVGSVNVTWDDPMDSAGNFFLVFGAADITNQGDGSIFDGRFGLMRVYRRALGVRDILRNYNNDRNNWLDTDLGEWSPATDITPALWYDASDTSSYTLSGSTLSSVTDKAGNFTVTVTGSPTRVSSGLNSLNVWDFDTSGSNQNLTTNSGPYSSGGNHWAIGVFQYHATDNTKDSFFSADGTRTYAVSSSQSNNTWTGEIDYDGSNSIVTGTARNTFSTSISQNTWVIVSVVFNKDGNQIFGRINGTTATSTDAYNLAMDTTATDVRMMRNRGGVHLDGRMAEYFHVAGAPGTGGTDISDVEKAEGYIAHKWGLEGNLPVSHPYKSSAPTA